MLRTNRWENVFRGVLVVEVGVGVAVDISMKKNKTASMRNFNWKRARAVCSCGLKYLSRVLEPITGRSPRYFIVGKEVFDGVL